MVTPSRMSSPTTAWAAPLNEAGWPVADATCRARFSAMTLLLSSSICATRAVSGGEATLAIGTARAGMADARTG